MIFAGGISEALDFQQRDQRDWRWLKTKGEGLDVSFVADETKLDVAVNGVGSLRCNEAIFACDACDRII